MELDQAPDQTLEQQADAMAGSGLRTVMRRALPASAKAPLEEKIAPPIKITDEEGYNALNPGMRFIDPDGVARTKSWTVTDEESYDLVPEGKEYVDPEGIRRTKPAYEDVDLTASTLYHMAVNDTERRKALERSYPGKVQQDTQGRFYVDDEGVRRRPKNMLESGTGAISTIAGAAAPLGASAGGEALGAAGGATFGAGVGALPGAIAGAGVGGALGQGFNDIILQLAGVYDRSGGEEALNLAGAGGFAAAGSSVGRSIGATIGGAGGVKQAIKSGAGSGVAAKFLGADPEGLESAIGLREKGALVPPSMWAKGAPHIQNMVEVFHPAFDTSKPLLKSATAHYEKSGASLLDQVGVSDAGSLVKPTAAVSSRQAGEALQAKVLAQSKAADDELRRVLDERRAGLQAGLPAAQEQQAAINRAAENSRREAQRLIDQGYQNIQQTMHEAARVSGAGHNGGDLWATVGERLQAVKRGLQERATVMYNQADELAGEHLPNVQGLPELAEQFASQLPEEFERNQPALVRQLRAMAGEHDPQTGAVIREPSAPTFGQLHNLRSQIRSNADFYRLNSDIKNGTYKFFARRVDEALHDPHAVPELQAAARQLDRADAFYRENMPIFEATQIKAVMRGLESGEPADPQRLFDTVVKEGHTDLTNRIREMVGPNLWAGVQAADLRQILNSSRGLVEGEIDGGAFTRQVLDRHRSGILDAVHGRDVSQRLLRQAQDVAALDGRIPLTLRPGDRMADAIAQAHATAEAARVAAKTDPLRTLNTEIKRMQREHAQVAGKARAERKNDPLGFLYDPTFGAAKAADKILDNEDLLIAAAGRFDPKSPEFNMLRQVWLQRFLRDTLKPSERLKTVSPEVQNIMFPGTTIKEMQTLAKEMDFLMSSKGADPGAGLSMSATGKVENPWGTLATNKGVLRTAIKEPFSVLPGSDAVARSVLGKYYEMVTKLSNNVAFMKWVQKGLKGDSQAREVVKEAVQRAMNAGGAVGAAVGESQYQAGSEGLPPSQENSEGGNQLPQGGLAPHAQLQGPPGAVLSDESPDPVRPGAQYASNEPAKLESALPQEPSNFLADADPAQQAQQAREVAARRQRQAVQPAEGRQEGAFTDALFDALIPGRAAVRSLTQGEYGQAAVEAGASAMPYAGKALGAAFQAAPMLTKAVAASTAALTSLFMDTSEGASKLSPEDQSRIRMMQEKSKLEQQQRTQEAERRKQEADQKAARDAEAAERAAKTEVDRQRALAEVEANNKREQARIDEEHKAAEQRAAEETIKANAAENKRMAERPFREKHPDADLGMFMGGIAAAAILPGATQAYKQWAFNTYLKDWEKLDAVATQALKTGTREEQQLAINRLTAAAGELAKREGKLEKYPWLTQLAAPTIAAEMSALPAEIDIRQPYGTKAHESAVDYYSDPATYAGLGIVAGGAFGLGHYSREAAEGLLPKGKIPTGTAGTVKTFEERNTAEAIAAEAAAKKKAESVAKRKATLEAKKKAEAKTEKKEEEPRKAKVPKGGAKIYGLRDE
jgi:hypothetical protein